MRVEYFPFKEEIANMYKLTVSIHHDKTVNYKWYVFKNYLLI